MQKRGKSVENKDEYKEENKQNEVIEESTVNKENETKINQLIPS